MPKILALLGLAACAPSEIEDLSVSGSDGRPVITWSGPDAAALGFDRDGASWLSLNPREGCEDVLSGDSGVTWDAWPDSHVLTLTTDLSVEPDLPALEDGEYGVAVGRHRHDPPW